MIPCPHCNTSFNPRMAFCPRCKEYATPREAHQSALKSKVAEDVDAGIPQADIREYLEAAGFSEVQIDTMLKDSWKAVAAVNRGYGFQRIILGVLALMGGGIVAAYFPVVGGMRWIGRAALAFGALAILSGLLTVFTGKEAVDR